jgi:hypothetical protein
MPKPESHLSDLGIHLVTASLYLRLKAVLEVWKDKVQDSKDRSGGKPSERYKHVEQLVAEIKQCLTDLPDSFV